MSATTKKEIFDGAIGIDLGTTNSCVAVWQHDHVEVLENIYGERTTPSWVGYTTKDEAPKVGKSVKHDAIKNLKNTIYDIKRLMGKRYVSNATPNTDEFKRHMDFKNELSNLRYKTRSDLNGNIEIPINSNKNDEFVVTPEEVSSEILKFMKDTAERKIGKIVDKAIITVPAYFNDSQRSATQHACIMAGMQCLRLINEPTAACICYGLDKKELTNVLVLDAGGGTTDVSVLRIEDGMFNVISTNGNTHLGGEDIDNLMVDYYVKIVDKKFETNVRKNPRAMHRLKQSVEKLKIELSYMVNAEQVVEGLIDGEDFEMKMSRALFEKLSEDFYSKCTKLIDNCVIDSKLDKSEIDEVVLVGGTTRIPAISKLVIKYFGENININKSVNPDEAIAYGASIQGTILTASDTSGKTNDLMLIDVIPLTLGVEIQGGLMSVIVPRNTAVPVTKSKMYSTTHDEQTSVDVVVFEGERKLTKDNHYLANFSLSSIPPMARGVPQIKVMFNINEDGLLKITATEMATDKTCEIVIDRNKNKLSQEEISTRIKDAHKNIANDAHYAETIKQQRETLEYFERIHILINRSDLKNALTIDQKRQLNEYLMMSIKWIKENGLEFGYGKIKECQDQFDLESKDLLLRLYSHKTFKERLEDEVEEFDMDVNETDINNRINEILENKMEKDIDTKKMSKFKQPSDKDDAVEEKATISLPKEGKRRGRGRPRLTDTERQIALERNRERSRQRRLERARIKRETEQITQEKKITIEKKKMKKNKKT